MQRRVCAARGPALYFARVRGCRFPMASNLFGTLERARFIFRDSLDDVRALVRAKVDPRDLVGSISDALRVPRAALHMLPREVKTGPALERAARVSELPQLVSWPKDGGAFVTLPEVYTEDPDAPGWRRSNLGMYRVQLSGGAYEPDVEVGMHYQIHRGIGVHQSKARRRGERLRASVWVGGPPATVLAAVMPLPEGMPEVAFAGALNRRALRLVRDEHGVAHADADFCVRGWVDPVATKPEGPFGDHLGYYSLVHDFPVLRVTSVTHRADAVWPFTVVGRPPQEDSTFGALIHEMVAPLVPDTFPGVSALHAVDAAGVHPLLLAVGSERYTPWAERRRPAEVLTQAFALLGTGQTSLAKYLFIAAREDDPPDPHDVGAFLRHVLERVDPERDWHFLPNTAQDTLDYSGSGLNEGSKVIVAGVGPKRRDLGASVPADLALPDGFDDARVALPGVLCVRGAKDAPLERLCASQRAGGPLAPFPLVVVVDDAAFAARSLDDVLWIAFTRSDPARDVRGVDETFAHKAWGCRGSVIVDARLKPHHAPPLEEDPEVERRVDRLFRRGGPLARWG